MKSFVFILFLFLSCQDQDKKPSTREKLVGKWNSVEHGTPEEVHKEAVGTLARGYATGFLLNSDSSYGLFKDYDHDGVPDDGGKINLGKYWNVEERQLVFRDAKTYDIFYYYDIQSVSENELMLTIPTNHNETGDYYIKFVRQ